MLMFATQLVPIHNRTCTYVGIHPLLAAELLKQLLSSQAPASVPGYCHRLGADMSVSKAHREKTRVVVHELHQGSNTGRASIGLLDVDTA